MAKTLRAISSGASPKKEQPPPVEVIHTRMYPHIKEWWGQNQQRLMEGNILFDAFKRAMARKASRGYQAGEDKQIPILFPMSLWDKIEAEAERVDPTKTRTSQRKTIMGFLRCALDDLYQEEKG